MSNFDLIWCYKILFKHVDLEFDDFFEWALHPGTRGHRFKLYKKSSCIHIRQSFFSERVVNVWNRLPAQIDFASLSSFTRTVKKVDLSEFLMCF